MLSKTFWQVVGIQKKKKTKRKKQLSQYIKLSLQQHLQFADTCGSLISWVTDKHRRGCWIRWEGWKRAHPHLREGALPTNNMGHRFPGQTVSWWSTGMPGLNRERRWQRRKSFYHISSRKKKTFVTHYKGNMAELPSSNPHLTGDIASG